VVSSAPTLNRHSCEPARSGPRRRKIGATLLMTFAAMLDTAADAI